MHSFVRYKGPQRPDTHWRQTIFLLKEEINVTKSSFLNGSITMTPNQMSPSSLNINIQFN